MSPEEENRLKELEDIIKKDLNGFVRVGMALKEIRVARLYRSKYTTWKDYLKAEWDMGMRIAEYQVKAFEIVENLKQNAHNCAPFENSTTAEEEIGSDIIEVLPRNEAQVRPLALLPPVQQITAWTQAVTRTNGKVTALEVNKVVEEILEKKKHQEKITLQKKVTREVDVPDDFTEAFRAILTVIDKHRSARWKDFKRKKAIEFVKALEQYLEPQKA